MECCLPLSLLQDIWRNTYYRLPNMADDLSKPTLYFGYGSNLWKQQMLERCPTSKFLGIARLKGYKWIINERGYANVVEVDQEDRLDEKHIDVVWGLVYSLQQKDEDGLDRNEGVPFAYTKENLEVHFWEAHHGKSPDVSDEKPVKVKMLVYINRKAVTPSKPKKEYIYRMNMGIKDALKEGLPEDYVKNVMRKFIPAEKT